MLTYLEICNNIRNYGVGTKFEKYEVINGVNVAKEVYLIVDHCELFNSEGDKYYGKKLKWDSGYTHDFNEEMLNFKFKKINPYTEVEISEAMEILRSGVGGVVYTEDCDGDMVAIDLDDDLSCDYDIDSFSDLVNLTKFYVK